IEDAHVIPADILAIGVASPGQIDIDNGTVLFSPLFHVKEDPFPFVARLRDYLDVHHIALISNDDAQGIGEQRIGVGKQIKDIVYLRIGYNIGASIIIDEKLYTGADNLAGMFGHMVVDLDGPECSCGNKGCLDTIVSRAAIGKKLLQRYREGKETILASELNKEPLDINSAVIAEAIDQEDLLTCQVVEEAAEVLGIGIANVINFLNPHRVILGGDVIDEIDLFFVRAVESARKKTLRASMRNVSIVRGTLGTTAAAYGAAVFAKEHLLRIREQQTV
ncbi:MAG: ROK family protein, partial [Ktedonobacteraceae bacterium]